jgi:hypothetical protein
MAKQDPQRGFTEMLSMMQAPFLASGPFGKPMEQYLEMQSGLLKEAEIFARHWFQRRNDAIETAVEALQKLQSNGTANPAGAVQAMADWQRGSVERLGADAQEWAVLCMHGAAAAATTPPQLDAIETALDTATQTRPDGRTPAKPKAHGATPV